MPMPLGDIADRIRRMQQMRFDAPVPETPDYSPEITLDMSPHELDMSSQSPIPDQGQLDSMTRQMQAYSYNPHAQMRDSTGALTNFPQYSKIPGASWRR